MAVTRGRAWQDVDVSSMCEETEQLVLPRRRRTTKRVRLRPTRSIHLQESSTRDLGVHLGGLPTNSQADFSRKMSIRDMVIHVGTQIFTYELVMPINCYVHQLLCPTVMSMRQVRLDCTLQVSLFAYMSNIPLAINCVGTEE